MTTTTNQPNTYARRATDTSDSDPGPTQAEFLIKLAAGAELFHTPKRAGYAVIEVAGHRETWPIRSKAFHHWLLKQFFDKTNSAPHSGAFNSALGVIEARAHFGAPQADVHLRVAARDDYVYIDLCDDDWRAIEISADGWRIVATPPARFRRTAGMQPLPEPECGGSIDMLRPFLNVRSEADFILIIAWLLAALRGKGPFPILIFSGEQGTGKSFKAAILRALVDPNIAALRALPRDDRDLFIAANNGYTLVFDNVSGLPGWISDTLCRLATGGGFAVRQLYSDADEILFNSTRPIMLNGIDDVGTRADLLDRAIIQSPQTIAEEKRKSENELWTEFNKVRSLILGALCEGIANGLKMLPSTQLNKLPRMADFSLWIAACESAYWPIGTFEAAYASNRNEAVDVALDGDIIASAIRILIAEQREWKGTASDLLATLNKMVTDQQLYNRDWPALPKELAARLRRIAPPLRKAGIEIKFTREGHARARIITITRSPD